MEGVLGFRVDESLLAFPEPPRSTHELPRDLCRHWLALTIIYTIHTCISITQHHSESTSCRVCIIHVYITSCLLRTMTESNESLGGLLLEERVGEVDHGGHCDAIAYHSEHILVPRRKFL
jgi:hypothetical protein